MSVEREFEIVQAEPEGGFSVLVPELSSVATQGETIEEATEMAKEAIEAYRTWMHEDGLPIPTVHRSRVAVHAAVDLKATSDGRGASQIWQEMRGCFFRTSLEDSTVGLVTKLVETVKTSRTAR
jgi:predicted RNase H-like HicB family nuclease